MYAGEDGSPCEICGCDINRGAPTTNRSSVMLTSDAHNAGIGLYHRIVRGCVGARSAPPVTRNRYPHELRINGVKIAPAKPELFQRTRTIIFHEHIGRTKQPVK